VSDAPEEPLHLLSHLRELFSGCLENFFVIGRLRYIPSLRDEWEGSILWVSPGKFVPQVVGHEKGEKISLAEFF
jgi:hypothetical protein